MSTETETGRSPVDVVVVGSVALDTIQTPFGRLERGLGGSATYFSMSASYFGRVGLVGVVGNDFPEPYVSRLAERNIDLTGFDKKPGQTFHWAGRYAYDLNVAETLSTELNVFADFSPALPAGYRAAPLLFLANIDPELQLRVLDQVASPRLVACDTMNFWISGKRDALLETLQRVDALLLNDAEARQLTGESNIVRAIRAVQELGPRIVVVKRGEYGALLTTGEHFFFAPAYPLEEVLDPTGAGDSFAGGFVGYLARRRNLDEGALRQAVIAGSVMASFCVEAMGTRRYDSLSPVEIRERGEHFRRLIDPQRLDRLL